MTPRRMLLVAAALLAVTALAAAAINLLGDGERSRASAPRPPGLRAPGGTPIDAAQIASGQLPMERLPAELGTALETHSRELVKNAEAIATKQARVTGTCAPGSAIRVIEEDGSVSCQRLPRGIVSVSALAGVPRLSGTGTAQGSVPGGVGRYQTSGEDDFLVVPVELPDGAVVTSFSYTFYDADPRVDGAAYLYRSDDKPLAALVTTDASDQVRAVTTETIQLKKVDAARYAYFVYFQTSAEAGANLLPISAAIGYKLP